MPSPRTARLAHQLQQEIATIIQQELKDPRLGFVTITRVELSSDLAHAKVFYSCLGTPEERTRSDEALEHSVRFIHGLLKKRLRLKNREAAIVWLPQLPFSKNKKSHDTSIRIVGIKQEKEGGKRQKPKGASKQ